MQQERGEQVRSVEELEGKAGSLFPILFVTICAFPSWASRCHVATCIPMHMTSTEKIDQHVYKT